MIAISLYLCKFVVSTISKSRTPIWPIPAPTKVQKDRISDDGTAYTSLESLKNNTIAKWMVEICMLRLLWIVKPARYRSTVEPIPPAPTTRTELVDNTFCPSIPIDGRIICLEYLIFAEIWSGMKKALRLTLWNESSRFQLYLGKTFAAVERFILTWNLPITGKN